MQHCAHCWARAFPRRSLRKPRSRYPAFALPTFAMGALFSHLCSMADAQGAGFGRATGSNGIGAALAPALFGVVAVPAVGAKWSLLLLSAGYLPLLPWRAWMKPWTWLPVAALLVATIGAPRLAFVDVPASGRILIYREGATAAVSVVEDGDGVRRLRIDNRQQEGSNTSYAFDARQAWLPLLLHPAPARALFLGMGTGVTAAAATEDPALQVDVVELLPEVISASEFFTREFAQPMRNPRVHVIAADARRYVRASGTQYDVIVSDNFHPARSGAVRCTPWSISRRYATASRPVASSASGYRCTSSISTACAASSRLICGCFHTPPAMIANNSLETPVIGLIGRADDGGFNDTAVIARQPTP